MAIRVTTYKQAFEGVLDIKISEKIKLLINTLEKEGHTERSISFTIWKMQDKLNAYKDDKRFYNILRNEINKWSWKKNDPRWQQYRDKKEQIAKADKMRKEIQAHDNAEIAIKSICVNNRRNKKTGFVYFIQGQCGGAIKIGYSVNPSERLKSLQTGYPDTLMILTVIAGNESIERAIHKDLEAFRLQGEWFRPDNYVINKIKEYKSMYNKS